MLFEYRYFGNTAVDSGVGSTGLSFAPDTTREPTYFSGKLRKKLAFRECISALHHVVESDLRFQPRDRTAYFAWLEQQELVDVAAVAASRKQVGAQLAAAQRELQELQRRQHGRRGIFYKARDVYFKWLYRKNKDYWFVLDPIITVHPDEVFFECFSQDESSYARVGCSYEVFEGLREHACGTTNVDYSSALYDEFQKIRDYRETELTVDPRGFEVQTAGDAGYREVKIDLPDSWVRGLLQVSSAMTLPGHRFSLHPMDVHNFCLWLRRHKETRSPRSIRFHLEPGRPIRATFEPWNHEITCARSVYPGPVAAEVRVWGRRRLHLLERLVPVARRFDVVLLGTGMPSFWIADCGDISFTLGLSGWTRNDWSGQANFDLLAPRADVDTETAAAVFGALKKDWRATAPELAGRLGMDGATVRSALQQYTQVGRVMYDLNKGVYRVRELSRDPLDMGALRFSNPREEEAAALVAQRAVTHRHARVDHQGHTAVSGKVGRDEPSLALNTDGRIVQAACSCSFHFQNKLRKGPCAHILALRLAHDRGLAETASALAPETQPEPPAGRVIPFEPLRAQQARDQEAERLTALFLGRGYVELVEGQEHLFVVDLRLVLEQKTPANRLSYLWDMLESSEAVYEFYIGYEELSTLLEEWG